MANLQVDRYDQEARSYIVTYSGRQLFYDDPGPGICIEDIAHGQSNLCRWSGQCRVFYSVAQHSVLCSQLGDSRTAMRKLFHDGSEAYYGDINKPLKNLLGPQFSLIEKRLEAAIWDFLGMAPMSEAIKKEVKKCDIEMSLAEAKALMGRNIIAEGYTAADIAIVPWTPSQAKAMFLERYEFLLRRNNYEVADMWPR